MWCAFLLCLLALANGVDIKDEKKEVTTLKIETLPKSDSDDTKAALTKRTAFPYASPYPSPYPAGAVNHAAYGAAQGVPTEQQEIPQEYLEIYQQLAAKQQQQHQADPRDPQAQAVRFLTSPVEIQGQQQQQLLAQQLLQQEQQQLQQQQQQQQQSPQPPRPPTTRRPPTEQEILQSSFFQSNQLQGQLRSLQNSRPNPTPPGSSIFQDASPSQVLNIHQARLQSTLSGRDPNYVAQQSSDSVYQQRLRVAEALNAEQQQLASLQAQEVQQQQLIQAQTAQAEQDALQAQTEQEQQEQQQQQQQQQQYYSQAPQAFPQPAPSSRPARQRTPTLSQAQETPVQSPPEQYLRETSPPTQFPPTYKARPETEQTVHYSPQEQRPSAGQPEYQRAQFSASELSAYLRQQHLQQQGSPSPAPPAYLQQASPSATPSAYLQRGPSPAAQASYLRQSSPSAASPSYVRQPSPPQAPPAYVRQASLSAAPPAYVRQASPSAAPPAYVRQASPSGAPPAYVRQASPSGAPPAYVRQASPSAAPPAYLRQASPSAGPVEYVQRAQPSSAPTHQSATSNAVPAEYLQYVQQLASPSPAAYRQFQPSPPSEDPSAYLRQQHADPSIYQQVQSATPATPAYRPVPETSDPSVYQSNGRQPQYVSPPASPLRPQTVRQQYVERPSVYYSRPEEQSEDPESKEFVSSLLSQHPGRSVFANSNRNEDALSLVKSTLASPSPSRSSIFVSTSNRTPKTQSSESEGGLPIVRLPTPQGQRALTQREYQALIAAGFDITPVDPVQAPHPSEQGYYQSSPKYQRSYATASPPVNQLSQSQTKSIQVPQTQESSGFTPIVNPELRTPTKLSRRRPNVPRKQGQQQRYQTPRESYEESHVIVDGQPESQTTYLTYDNVPEVETSYATRRRMSGGHRRKAVQQLEEIK